MRGMTELQLASTDVSFASETQRTLWVNVEQIELIVINKDKGMKAR